MLFVLELHIYVLRGADDGRAGTLGVEGGEGDVEEEELPIVVERKC